MTKKELQAQTKRNANNIYGLNKRLIHLEEMMNNGIPRTAVKKGKVLNSVSEMIDSIFSTILDEPVTHRDMKTILSSFDVKISKLTENFNDRIAKIEKGMENQVETNTKLENRIALLEKNVLIVGDETENKNENPQIP